MKTLRLSLLSLILLLPLATLAQDEIFKMSPKFLSLRNSKLSIGLGVDGAFPAMMKSTSNPSGLEVDYKNNRFLSNSIYPYVSGGVSVDVYSDNSLTGLLGGVNYSLSTTAYRAENVATDYFSINRIDIPVYLKLRPGAISASKHLWLMAGGIFSIPVSVKRQFVTTSSTTPDGATFTDTNISQASKLYSLAASLGYETFISKTTRGAVFVSGSYALNSQFNKEYIEYNVPAVVNGNGIGAGGRSTLADFPNYASHEIRLTLGVKFLFKLTRNVIKEDK